MTARQCRLGGSEGCRTRGLDLRLYHDLHLHGPQRRSGRGKREWKQARKESRRSEEEEEEEEALMIACMKRRKSHEGERCCDMGGNGIR